jgi:long-subunit acyl-CoA synthetase (AMP-forming)
VKTLLQFVYDHEEKLASRIWLTQPMGGGELREFTWKDAMGEVRRMAAHLKERGYPPGSRIAILSKNCAWWFMVDLAIWMAGHVSVPVYPDADGRERARNPRAQRSATGLSSESSIISTRCRREFRRPSIE